MKLFVSQHLLVLQQNRLYQCVHQVVGIICWTSLSHDFI